MLVSGECCRWGSVRACFALLEVHAFNETVRDGINVPHLAVRKDIATKAFHELMNFDVGNAAFLVDYFKWFHVRIKLLPLTGRVGPDLFFHSPPIPAAPSPRPGKTHASTSPSPPLKSLIPPPPSLTSKTRRPQLPPSSTTEASFSPALTPPLIFPPRVFTLTCAPKSNTDALRGRP